MQQNKIGIVEDELIIADSIRAMLLSMNYVVPEPCCDYQEALVMLQKEQPDLVLLDINLSGSEQDGIAVARYIRECLNIPYIFLTANSDAGTLAKAKAVTPNAFLVKPFLKEDLYTAIEIALHNFYAAGTTPPANNTKDHIFVKEGNLKYKVLFSDILYLESEHVYVIIHTAERKYLVRNSLQYYTDLLDQEVFIRIHRGYVVNKLKIDKVGFNYLEVGHKMLPVSKKYREALTARL